jgi:AraC-like DNA-binding protein
MIYTHLPIDSYFLEKFKKPVFHPDVLYKQDQAVIIKDGYINGCSKRIDFEPGIFIQILDITFTESISFTKLQSLFSTTEKWYLNAYFMEPTKAYFNTLDSEEYKEIELRDCIFSMPGSNLSNLQFKKGSTIKGIIIAFTTDWLLSQLNGNEMLYQFNISCMKQDGPFVLVKRLSKYEMIHIKEFFNHALATSTTLLIRAYTYYFLHQSFDHITNKRLTVEVSRPHTNYEELIAEVENKIIQSIRSQIPCIKELAKECYLSESTLKRYFKKAFGKNIYEYYLTKKMELAHELLTERGWSVTKITIFLGYKSNSHFSTLFKKIYGYVPSQAAKKAAGSAVPYNLK